MNSRSLSSVLLSSFAVSCATLLASCNPTGPGGTVTPTVAVTPICSILATSFSDNPEVDSATISDRTDTNVNHGFTRFRRLSGPRGNSAVGFREDVFGINEAWLRNPVSPSVLRGQAHPAKRPSFNDFKGAARSLNSQDNTGTWSPVLNVGSATRRDDQVSREDANPTTPQFMPVGVANPQMFACVGTRNEDNTGSTTSLLEVMPRSAGVQGGMDFIQDVLNGDSRFVPNTPGPLRGPANPPTPPITGPGNAVRSTSVKCAMTQSQDDLMTRELHVIGIDNGHLYYSRASNFSTATTGNGFAFSRFNNIVPWLDVGQQLGGNFGNIIYASIIASRPTAISILFVSENNGLYRLFHAVRFSPSGTWRPVDNVLLLSGGSPTGVGTPVKFNVAGGMCPIFNEGAAAAQTDELVYAMWNPDFVANHSNLELTIGRIVSTPRQWPPTTIQGVYSPLMNARLMSGSNTNPPRNERIQSLSITTRPFRDDAKPPAPPP